MSDVVVIESEADLRRCHPVMAQLRPDVDESSFVARVARQRSDGGYRVAAVESDGRIVAVVGYRISECLAWGRFLYVDDLVTDAEHRSHGHGRALLDWLVAQARLEGCDELHLDSGVQRFAAHRFYLRHGMDITSHHFRVTLGQPERRTSDPSSGERS